MKRAAKICIVATIELPVRVFLRHHIENLSRDHEVTVVVNTVNTQFLNPYGLDVKVVAAPIERRLSPLRDIGALIFLYRLFRRSRFRLVHSVMPKSGLLSMMASCAARVPIRIHTFTGQVWASQTGLGRRFFKMTDRLLAACATHILVDSPSQHSFLIREGVVERAKATVIGEGSICGVDTRRFAPDPAARSEIRALLSLPEDAVLFLYLGRLNRDKGLLDLGAAFNRIAGYYKSAYLLFVGPDEEGIGKEIERACGANVDRVRFEGYTERPEAFMAAADVFCLPSYREGFGIVIVEAASAGIPSIGSRIYGITDTIEDGVTGLLFKAGDVDELAARMKDMIDRPDTRRELGRKAMAVARNKFSEQRIETFMIDFYRGLLS